MPHARFQFDVRQKFAVIEAVDVMGARYERLKKRRWLGGQVTRAGRDAPPLPMISRKDAKDAKTRAGRDAPPLRIPMRSYKRH
jgi:hypothetical protein